MNIIMYFRNGEIGREELNTLIKDIDMEKLTLSSIGDILSK